MKNTIFLTLTLCLSISLSLAQSLEWAYGLGSTGDDYASSVAIDDQGNIYSIGNFNNAIDADPGPGVSTLSSFGEEDIYIQKLDPDGNFLWAKSFGGADRDIGTSIMIDQTGNVLTTGWFLGTVDFDPGAGTASLSSNGDADIFVQKLDSDGNFLWANSMGGSASDLGSGIAVNDSGEVYVTGSFRELVDFDPDTGHYVLTATGEMDIFVQKLDANGEFIWAKQMGGTSFDAGQAIAVDDSGHVVVAGRFSDSVDFDPGVGVHTLTSNGSDDIFVLKLDASGDFLWAKGMGGTGRDLAGGIAVDGSGQVYAIGYFNGPVDFDPGMGNPSSFQQRSR